MTNWEERITRDTAPSIRLEHVLRYAAAADVARSSELWCDLGCGTGVAPATAFGDSLPAAALLVDVDAGALADATSALPIADMTTLTLDLADVAGVAELRARLSDRAANDLCVTCFEVIEHLQSFEPLLQLLIELCDGSGCTVFTSVPNDAFTSVRNPFHQTSWGEASVEELRSTLPQHVLLEQVSVGGSALRRPGEETQVEVATDVAATCIPTHFLLCFGRRAGEVGLPARAWPVDLAAQRMWERQREANLAYFSARTEALERELEELAERHRHGTTPASGPSGHAPA